MKEINAILQAYEKAEADHLQAALVTVVKVEGSSYRRPGARMLVTEDGRMTGAISGGCLEGDALRKALLVVHQQKSKLVTYDTSNEEDAAIGVQLGCAGIIHVLMEPIQTRKAGNPIELFRKITQKRQSAVLITLFSTEDPFAVQAGTCWLLEENGSWSGNLPGNELNEMIGSCAREALQQKKSSLIRIPGNTFLNGFIEYLPAPISLLIAGAGNDVFPLVEMAGLLGWNTTVIDGRPTHANPSRFQAGCQLIVSSPENLPGTITYDARTAAALMTHNYVYDKAMLKELLKTEIPYIGLLGPRKKLDRMLQELIEEGLPVSEEQRNRIYGPVGFDIGAETSEEIALAITTEIQACMAGKTGPSLKNKTTGIHATF
ncbi:XdhC/CoxI family protein [Flavihumibacter sp. CACIAM 22H1]|uniref:XdhC family protein n=1 Tax=Flavihumibacter sp. CACIAM 22H1 TaxID=1812911 RepID=UPI0007A8E842|nr:XdhC/CoxI family protein [Flavihumibacter sp. CACIAM 22H1]KYP14716.1 MAG: alanine dehydrogenase [Flavihumibacter sp. CACIAM 22H1]